MTDEVREKYVGTLKPWTRAPNTVEPKENEIPEFGSLDFCIFNEQEVRLGK
jgi:hypothetical protein